MYTHDEGVRVVVDGGGGGSGMSVKAEMVGVDGGNEVARWVREVGCKRTWEVVVVEQQHQHRVFYHGNCHLQRKQRIF